MAYLIITIAVFSLLILFSFILTKDRRIKKRIESIPFPNIWKNILHEKVVFYRNLCPDKKNIFEKRVQLFLALKRITGIDTDVSDEDRLMIAASAVIPIFGFPEWEYGNLSEILLYPGSFDENYQTSGEAPIAGMAGAGGWSSVMILSKPDLHGGFRQENDGSNVGIHEFVHYLDMADGEVDGIPSLLLENSFAVPWIGLIKKEIHSISSGKSDINPYGSVSDIEFLAVVSEYFFEKPERLKREHPELFDMLNRIFRQDVISVLKRGIKPGKRKVGRNAHCICGSGKKYKKCCGR